MNVVFDIFNIDTQVLELSKGGWVRILCYCYALIENYVYLTIEPATPIILIRKQHVLLYSYAEAKRKIRFIEQRY